MGNDEQGTLDNGWIENQRDDIDSLKDEAERYSARAEKAWRGVHSAQNDLIGALSTALGKGSCDIDENDLEEMYKHCLMETDRYVRNQDVPYHVTDLINRWRELAEKAMGMLKTMENDLAESMRQCNSIREDWKATERDNSGLEQEIDKLKEMVDELQQKVDTAGSEETICNKFIDEFYGAGTWMDWDAMKRDEAVKAMEHALPD